MAEKAADESNGGLVKTRLVFYIPGYDPIHPRRYRELYRKEGRTQAQISQYRLELTAQRTGTNYGWKVNSTIDNHSCSTDFEVLVWSDIVRDSMVLTIFQTYVLMLRTAWTYIESGALLRLMQLRKGPVIAALYPVGMLILQLIISLLACWATNSAFTVIAPTQHDWLTSLIGWLLGIIIAIAILRWFRKIDHKLFVYYLMHDYSYSAQMKGENPRELEQRMSEFKDRIASALQQNYDEILIVGHSSGAHIAVSIIADLLRENKVNNTTATLSFLSLGQVVPMVSFLPNAYRLRADLRYLSTQDRVCWVDVTAPGDGCAFALCDPVGVSGVAPNHGKQWPLVISAAFTQTLSPERWAELRWRFFRLHFQYLCAFDRPRDYDYFQISAGPLTLRERFKNRKPSSSRIEKPVSKYCSTSS